MKKHLAPSILSADFSNLAQQIRLVEMAGASFIHCDVMDGHFVPNITIGPLVVKAVKKSTSLPVDVHLMIENPENYVESFVKSGADFLTVHYEGAVHLHRTVSLIKSLGAKAGVAINPATPVSHISEIAEYIDLLLVMSVDPGFGGQAFIPASLRRIEEAAELRGKIENDFLIEVDGGIGKDNIKLIADAGCDVFVAGSSIYNADNVSAATTELNNLINQT